MSPIDQDRRGGSFLGKDSGQHAPEFIGKKGFNLCSHSSCVSSKKDWEWIDGEVGGGGDAG